MHRVQRQRGKSLGPVCEFLGSDLGVSHPGYDGALHISASALLFGSAGRDLKAVREIFPDAVPS